jgi:internalin A
MVSTLLLFNTGCNSTGNKSQRPDKAIMEASKPEVDSTKVIELIDLYRAKRFEDFQTALAAGKENVHKISFHGRKIGTLSEEIAQFSYLATLDVANNDLPDLPGAIAELHYLQGFYANGNNLVDFPEQLLLLPLLARLNLSDNQITRLPPEIKKMDQLDYLALEANQLTSVPVQLYDLKRVTALNLASNGLSDLPDGISGMESLKKLDLSGNQLTDLPEDLTNMSGHLEELSIHNNRIPQDKVEWLIEAMPSTKIRY